MTNNSTYYLQTYIEGSSPYTVTKIGDGTLVFMDTNISNFSASTVISNGTVSVSDNNTLGTGTINNVSGSGESTLYDIQFSSGKKKLMAICVLLVMPIAEQDIAKKLFVLLWQHHRI